MVIGLLGCKPSNPKDNFACFYIRQDIFLGEKPELLRQLNCNLFDVLS